MTLIIDGVKITGIKKYYQIRVLKAWFFETENFTVSVNWDKIKSFVPFNMKDGCGEIITFKHRAGD